MIVLIAQMWPGGDPSKAYEIGRTYIANAGGHITRGDYQVAVCRRGSTAVPKPIDPDGPAPTRQAQVKNYPRLAYNPWRLFARAIVAAFPEEKSIAATGKNLVCDEQDLLLEPSDEQALALGCELNGVLDMQHEITCAVEITAIGRAAWLRGARPRGGEGV